MNIGDKVKGNGYSYTIKDFKEGKALLTSSTGFTFWVNTLTLEGLKNVHNKKST